MKEAKLPDYLVMQGQKELSQFVKNYLEEKGFDLSKPFKRVRDFRTNTIIFTQED